MARTALGQLLALYLATQFRAAAGVGLLGRARSKSSSAGSVSDDFFNPTFAAPQLTPKQFLIISSPSEQKVVYTELKNFKSTTGRTFALVDSGLSDPRGLSLDGTRGALYIADKTAKKIFRYSVTVSQSPDSSSLQLQTSGVQLCIMENADTSWVNVDLNGDVFYSDETKNTINRIPLETIEMLASGQSSAGQVSLISLKTSSGSISSDEAQAYIIYEGSANPHVTTPAGVASDGARLYWTNSVGSNGSAMEGLAKPHLQEGMNYYPSMVLSNETDTGYGIAKSSKLVFWTSDDKGRGKVNGVTPTGTTFSFVTGLSNPRGLVWDRDQTVFVADQAAGAVYSLPVGRVMTNAPLTKSAVLTGAYGVAVFGEFDKAWTA